MNKLKASLIIIVLLVIALLGYRGMDFFKCKTAAYDLKRSTEFSWITGNCMVERGNGERIYLNQMRGYEE